MRYGQITQAYSVGLDVCDLENHQRWPVNFDYSIKPLYLGDMVLFTVKDDEFAVVLQNGYTDILTSYYVDNAVSEQDAVNWTKDCPRFRYWIEKGGNFFKFERPHSPNLKGTYEELAEEIKKNEEINKSKDS